MFDSFFYLIDNKLYILGIGIQYMEKKVADFSIKYIQILDENGNVDEDMMPKLSNEDIIRMFRLMVLSRKFDETALKLQREGRLGVYAPLRGQEACQIGTVSAMNKNDMLFPMYRDTGMIISRGHDISKIIQTIRGDERGAAIPVDANVFPYEITVASQYLHASGFGIASSIKDEDRATVVSVGDGGTSKADFYEAMNFAGVFKAKTLFICENNQYAISVRRENQTAASTIAQKAIAVGIEGVQVDGNDVFGVHHVVKKALENARKGIPSLIEMITYRMENHTTADDAGVYRPQSEVEEWLKKDPISRLEKYMEAKNIITEDEKKKIIEECEHKIDSSIAKADTIKPPNPTDMFKYMYAEMPKKLSDQMSDLNDS